jgi:hypothetical protein
MEGWREEAKVGNQVSVEGMWRRRIYIYIKS